MRWRLRFAFGLPLLAAVLILAGCSRRAPPAAVQGLLDLSGWNFETDGAVNLDGEWEFYWGRLLTPAGFAGAGAGVRPTGFIPVPGPWSGHKVGGAALPIDGYATYRLRVRLPGAGGMQAIAIPYVCMSYRLWGDGELLAANGVVGTDRRSAVPETRPLVAFFTPRAETIEIVLQAANFHHRCNRIWASLRLGAPAQIARQEELRSALALFHFGVFLIMTAYHLALYALRGRDRSSFFILAYSL